MVKIDLHIHTKYSKCAFIEPHDLVAHAKAIGLEGIAITDHNSTEAVKEVKKLAKEAGLIFIPAIEVRSAQGDIVGLGIEKVIPKGLSAAETISQIHKLGGLAIAVHPYAFLFHRHSVGDLIKSLNFDAIEVFNSRNLKGNKKANRIATELKKSKTAGSDAHSFEEIGSAYTIVDSSPNIEAILNAIKKGRTRTIGKRIELKVAFKYCIKRVNSLIFSK